MKVMIGTPVKDAGLWISTFLDVVSSFTFKNIRHIFIYGISYDGTLDHLKKYAKSCDYEVEIYREPFDPLLREYGIQAGASIYRDFQMLIDEEDYFMLMDCDIISAPVDLIEKLMSLKADISAPYVWNEGKTQFYDSFIFRVGDKRFSPFDPPKVDYPFEVTSVGTCFLSKAKIFKETEITNPYPNLSFCRNAKQKFNCSIVVDPRIEIFHKDLESLGIEHLPKLGVDFKGEVNSDYIPKRWNP